MSPWFLGHCAAVLLGPASGDLASTSLCPGMALPWWCCSFDEQVAVTIIRIFQAHAPFGTEPNGTERGVSLVFLSSFAKSRQILFSFIGVVSNFDRSNFLLSLSSREVEMFPLPKKHFLFLILSLCCQKLAQTTLFLTSLSTTDRGLLKLNP